MFINGKGAKLTPEARDQAVTDLIDLVGAVDGILQAQSAADADYFLGICDRTLSDVEQVQVKNAVLKAYRWQYIVSGVREGNQCAAAAPAASNRAACLDGSIVPLPRFALRVRCPVVD
jgi:hypothetical protein